MLASYGIGDFVVPTDLPRRFLCRVTYAHDVGDTSLQVLELEPLEGPWSPDTRLIRGGESVRPAVAAELWSVWRARWPRDRSVRPRRRRTPPSRHVMRPRGSDTPGAA